MGLFNLSAFEEPDSVIIEKMGRIREEEVNDFSITRSLDRGKKVMIKRGAR